MRQTISNTVIATAFEHSWDAIKVGDGITAAQLLKTKWRSGTAHEKEYTLQLARLEFNDASYSLFLKNLKS